MRVNAPMRHMRTLYLLPILTCFVVAPAHAQLGLALSPMRVEVKLAPGKQYTDTVRLTNDSPGRMRVKGGLLDWFIDDQMTPQFDESYPQEAKLSCKNWLQLNPRESDLDGNGVTRVRFTVAVPAGTPEGEYHCAAG